MSLFREIVFGFVFAIVPGKIVCAGLDIPHRFVQVHVILRGIHHQMTGEDLIRDVLSHVAAPTEERA